MDENISIIHQLRRELEDQEHDNHLLQRQVNELAKDAERYRALRFCGDEFNRYVVVSVNGLVGGSMTYSGDRLDFVADQMIQEQRSMTAKGAAT